MNEYESESTGKTFNILAVDGGGFKGLFSAVFLCELETAHGPLHEHFDLLCGTSTGSLVILPLALGRSANEIAQFYKDWGPKIFPQCPLPKVARFLYTKARYSDYNLRQAATAVLGSARMRDAKTPVCIPSFDVTNAVPRVFKTDHHSTLNRDGDLLMSEVALASASAPSFFPKAMCAERHGPVYYVDGGIWANNPALIGLVEACRFFVGEGRPYSRVRILSVSNVSAGAGKLVRRGHPKLMEFVTDMLSWTMEAQRQSIDHCFEFLVPMLRVPVEYVRIGPYSLSPEQNCGIGLDIATKSAVETLAALAAREGSIWKSKPEIVRFFRR